MTTAFDFDFFVIGGGSGGVRAARMAAQRQPGLRVAVAEFAAMGGTCVNVGCIPKKLYSYAAHYADAFAEAPGFGWKMGNQAPQFDWQTLKTRRAAEILRLNGIYEKLLASAGVRIIKGWARLIDAHTVAVDDNQHFTARHILVATGGTPTVPEVEGKSRVVTSDSMFDLPEFPKRLVVVGAGYIACEFASIFNGLGAEVVQIHRGPQLLTGFDADVQRFIAAEMVKSGVDIRFGTQVEAVRASGNHASALTVHTQTGEAIAADTVLYATGRVPNASGIGLGEAGVATRAKDGAIEVNADYRTNVPSIYAVGDVTARVQLTPVALGEAMVVVDQLFGPPAGKAPRCMGYDLIPTAVFTHPNIGTVGATEAQARAAHKHVSVYKTDFKPLKHTLSGSTERTFMKLLVDTETDRVVGLHMVGPDAGEVVQGFAVALQAGATKADFDRTIGIHPTLAEEFVTMREAVRD